MGRVPLLQSASGHNKRNKRCVHTLTECNVQSFAQRYLALFFILRINSRRRMPFRKRESSSPVVQVAKDNASGGVFKRAAIEVLKHEKMFMRVKDITQRAIELNLLTGLVGKTPDNTMASTLFGELKKKKRNSELVKPAPGLFGLRGWHYEKGQNDMPLGLRGKKRVYAATVPEEEEALSDDEQYQPVSRRSKRSRKAVMSYASEEEEEAVMDAGSATDDNDEAEEQNSSENAENGSEPEREEETVSASYEDAPGLQLLLEAAEEIHARSAHWAGPSEVSASGQQHCHHDSTAAKDENRPDPQNTNPSTSQPKTRTVAPLRQKRLSTKSAVVNQEDDGCTTAKTEDDYEDDYDAVYQQALREVEKAACATRCDLNAPTTPPPLDDLSASTSTDAAAAQSLQQNPLESQHSLTRAFTGSLADTFVSVLGGPAEAGAAGSPSKKHCAMHMLSAGVNVAKSHWQPKCVV